MLSRYRIIFVSAVTVYPLRSYTSVSPLSFDVRLSYLFFLSPFSQLAWLAA
jgi:hypothetical protein